MRIPIIGETKRAEEEREALRFAMRIAKSTKEKAEHKREFRKARNKVIYLKDKDSD